MPYKDIEEQRKAQKKHYENNKQAFANRRNNTRRALREMVSTLKESSPCVDCNTLYPYYVMQYDHVDGHKINNVSRLIANSNMQAVLDEIAKCELVCANCHAIRTHKRRVMK